MRGLAILFALVAALSAGCAPGRAGGHPAAASSVPPAAPAAGLPAPPRATPAPSASPAQAAEAGTPKPAPRVEFASQVRPLLKARCSPCHFEGGRMYDRLPFDQEATIRTLGQRLFTRIKDPEDQELLRAFLDQPPDWAVP